MIIITTTRKQQHQDSEGYVRMSYWPHALDLIRYTAAVSFRQLKFRIETGQLLLCFAPWAYGRTGSLPHISLYALFPRGNGHRNKPNKDERKQMGT